VLAWAMCSDWVVQCGLAPLTNDRAGFMQPSQFIIWLPRVGVAIRSQVVGRSNQPD